MIRSARQDLKQESEVTGIYGFDHIGKHLSRGRLEVEADLRPNLFGELYCNVATN